MMAAESAIAAAPAGPGAPGDDDPAGAEIGKLRGLIAVGAHHAGRVLHAQRVLLQRLLDEADGATVTIDDVRRGLGELPDKSPRWLGAVPAGLRAAGLLERVAFVESKRRVSHARPISEWRLCDRAAAEQWLRDNGGNGQTGGPAPPGEKDDPAAVSSDRRAEVANVGAEGSPVNQGVQLGLFPAIRPPGVPGVSR